MIQEFLLPMSSLHSYLGNNILGVFLAIKLQLDTNIAQRNLRVRQTDHSDTSLDDIVVQTEESEVVFCFTCFKYEIYIYINKKP